MIPMVEDHEGLIFTIGISFQLRDYTIWYLMSSLYITIIYRMYPFTVWLCIMGTILWYIT